MGTLVLTILLGCLTCQVLGQWPTFPNANPNPNSPGVGGGAWPGNPGYPVGGNPNMPRPGQPGAPLAGCRPGWTNFGNYCYKFFFQRLPYNEANQMCMRYSAMAVPPGGGFGFGGGRPQQPRQQPGGPQAPPPFLGHLIVTKDMNHNKFQHNWLRYTGASGNKVWMGLKELGQETNRYFWADGTELFYTRGYPFFNRFKPDQPQQNSIQQAVHSFNNRPDNSWVTTNIETEMSFICQYQYKF